MYDNISGNLCLLIPFVLAGCSTNINKSLSPPTDTKWVYVEIKNPSPYTRPFPLGVRYISYKCMKKRVSGFDGSVITEPSYNVIQIPLRQEKDDFWKGQVAMTGGGRCQWTLSAVDLGIEYIEASHLGKDLVPGAAVGLSIAFDKDAARNGQFKSILGDISSSPIYYPYIIEKKIGNRVNTLNLLGERTFISLWSGQLNKIEFSPAIDESKIVKFVGVERKIDGVYPKIIYPDGSIAPERTLFPDFKKVDGMILK